MHKSSFQSMEKFKNTYLIKYSSLKILDIGSYDSSGTNYNYSRFLKEKNWQYHGMDIHEGSNVDIVVSDIYNWVEIETVKTNKMNRPEPIETFKLSKMTEPYSMFKWILLENNTTQSKSNQFEFSVSALELFGVFIPQLYNSDSY